MTIILHIIVIVNENHYQLRTYLLHLFFLRRGDSGMKKRQLKGIFASFLMASAVLTACGAQETAEKPKEEKQEETATAKESEEKAAEEVDFAAVYQEAITELDKAK